MVRVTASSVNPVDSAIAAGMLKGMADYRFPVVLGRDFAGIVQGVGSGVDDYQEGDEVYGYLLHAAPDVHDGSWAELTVVPADGFVDRKPAEVGWPEAGAATRGPKRAPLRWRASPRSAASMRSSSATATSSSSSARRAASGSSAVQLAARAGAQVIAAGLPEDESYLRGLGATGGSARSWRRARYGCRSSAATASAKPATRCRRSPPSTPTGSWRSRSRPAGAARAPGAGARPRRSRSSLRGRAPRRSSRSGCRGSR